MLESGSLSRAMFLEWCAHVFRDGGSELMPSGCSTVLRLANLRACEGLASDFLRYEGADAIF